MGDIVSFLVPHHGASSSSAAYYYAPDNYANDDADGGDDGYDDGYDDDGYDDPSMLFRAVGACMFLFGLGVGGEYPVSAVSAVSASERVMSSSSSSSCAQRLQCRRGDASRRVRGRSLP